MRASALLHPLVDPWLLGGLSLAFFLVFLTLHRTGATHALGVTSGVGAALLYLINLPHFLASYHLAYSRGKKFVLAHWPQLLALPAAMVAVIALGFVEYGSVGPRVAGTGFLLLYSSVGWHYAKQIYGSIVVTAIHERYPLDARQKKLLKYSLLSVWWLALVQANTAGRAPTEILGFEYPSLGLPSACSMLALAIFLALTIATILEVWVRNMRQHGRELPWASFLPWVAFYLWWLPNGAPLEWKLVFVPIFHSLQYFCFYGRIQSREAPPASRSARVAALLGLGVLLVALAFALFDFVPRTLDSRFSPTLGGAPYFLATIGIFFNLHHYFVDSVIWRLSDAELRRKLLT